MSTVIFAGGGTGGHIFPALAIAESLLARTVGSAPAIQLLVSSRPLDAQILGRARLAGKPVSFQALPAHPPGLRPRALYRFLTTWGQSVRESRAVIARARANGPVVLVAMGGFVAAPAAQAARVERVPLLLVNLDAVPGKANRRIARVATRIVTAAPVHGSDWHAVPPIVRESVVAGVGSGECRARLGLEPSCPVLLITGGSQGAGSINDFMRRFLEQRGQALRGWQVLHQTGAGRAGDLRQAYAACGIAARVEEFVEDMGVWWAAAELAVCRCGAGNVAEAWASGVPALMLPYPYHKDDHQRENARVLEDTGAGGVARDLVDADANMRTVAGVLVELLSRAEARERMRTALRSLGPANGSAQVAEILRDMVAASQ